MLTTKDNPYNPHEDYDAWLMWDHEHGYYTQELLAHIAPIDDYQTPQAYAIILSEAINQIIASDPLDIYEIV